MDDKISSLEALLFIHGEPISLKKVQNVLKFTPAELKSALSGLQAKLEGSGLAIIADESIEKMLEGMDLGSKKIQLVTRPEFGKILEDFVKDELSEELSPASLEVLAIVAYLAPATRARIEYVRGVNSTFTLRNLLLRGLVTRAPNPENPNTYLYEPSFEFLRHIGVSSREELPEYEKFSKLLNQPPEPNAT